MFFRNQIKYGIAAIGLLFFIFSCGDISRRDFADASILLSDVCGLYRDRYDPNTTLLTSGNGEENAPYYICEPEQLRLIGNTAVNPDYSLDKHYALARDILVPDNLIPLPVGGPCGTTNAFTGSFDGRGYSISSVGRFNSPEKEIYRTIKTLLLCPTNVRNLRMEVPEEQVCAQIDNTTLMTREDSAMGPYIVCSREHLEAIGSNLTNDYALYQDIDLANALFTPIGGVFTGAFDGKRRIIQNLNINETAPRVGLFRELGSGGAIRNLGIEGVNVRGAGSNVGALVGRSEGEIMNSYASDTDNDNNNNTDVMGGASQVGGLVGFQVSGSIENSYSEVSVEGSRIVGGLVGELSTGANTEINNSYALGSVTSASFAGGLVGFSNVLGNIRNSYAAGDVTGTNSVGGLVGIGSSLGRNEGIRNSYALGNVTGTSSVGGLIGTANNDIIIANSYAAGGAIMATSMPTPIVGGLLGRDNNATAAYQGVNYFTAALGGADGVGSDNDCDANTSVICARETAADFSNIFAALFRSPVSITMPYAMGWSTDDWTNRMTQHPCIATITFGRGGCPPSE